MTDTHPSTRLLGLSGSLRRASHNTAILRTLAGRLNDCATLRLFPLDEIPLYNQDLDGDTPPAAVSALKAAVAEADALVLCSPEYNHGMSGVLKNALDWVSRPAFKSPLKDKPVLIMTASPAYTGGVRAQAQLRETLSACLAHVIARPEVVIAAAHEKVRDGRLIDEATLKFALDAMTDLVEDVRRQRRAAAAAREANNAFVN